MSESTEGQTHTEPVPSATLEPPGTIAVIGAGPLGLEAALYGRFLGYDVTVFEAVAIAHSLTADRQSPVPMMPDRCASPLAKSALAAQRSAGKDAEAVPQAAPLTVGEWIDRVWQPLTETDLLRGRLRCPLTVRAIDLVEVDDHAEGDSGEPDDEPIPPDFRLSFDAAPPEQFEAVIDATGGNGQEGADHPVRCSFATPADYYFRIGDSRAEDGETRFWQGLKQIVAVYATLGGGPSWTCIGHFGIEAPRRRGAGRRPLTGLDFGGEIGEVPAETLSSFHARLPQHDGSDG